MLYTLMPLSLKRWVNLPSVGELTTTLYPLLKDSSIILRQIIFPPVISPLMMGYRIFKLLLLGLGNNMAVI
jgi:hypothetical protein